MTLIKLFTTIALTACLYGCATTSNDSTYSVYRHDPNAAAVADLVTTAAALGRGAHELNPMGVNGAIAAKALYLFGIRPGLGAEERAASDRFASAVWYGGAANNLVLIIFPSAGMTSVAVGLWAGWTTYSGE